jgi:hypothetical protein
MSEYSELYMSSPYAPNPCNDARARGLSAHRHHRRRQQNLPFTHSAFLIRMSSASNQSRVAAADGALRTWKTWLGVRTDAC